MGTIRKLTFTFSIVILGLFIVLFSFSKSQAQCDLKFDYKVEHTSNGLNNGKILLKLESGEGPFVVHLFDLGSTGNLISTKKYETFSPASFLVVFDKIKPGEYLVRIDNDKCKKSLTGIDSLQIK